MTEQTADMLARVLFKVYPDPAAELEAARPLIEAALAWHVVDEQLEGQPLETEADNDRYRALELEEDDLRHEVRRVAADYARQLRAIGA